jgi:RNA polymerase sigma-70 factor (ECF subfamily)
MSDAAAGSPIDWQAALARHDRWLRTVAFARLRCRDAVDEVMQEVALAVFRQRAPLADPARLSPWLYRLTVLQSLMHRRAAGRRRKHEQSAAEAKCDSFDSSAYDPLLWLLADERRRQVREAIGELRPKDAEMLLLKYTESWSYRQIAEHLGLREAAVEARLHRARQKLRERLAAKEAVSA